MHGLQVLFTMPDSADGGIGLRRRRKEINDDIWQTTSATDPNNPFRGVARYSGLAATQAGRVYAVVDGGGGVELREWEYVPDEDSYKVVGRVDTEVPR